MPYAVTDRKRAAARRWQQRQRDAVPLLADLVAQQQPSIDQIMDERMATWGTSEQANRDRRAQKWRKARRILDAQPPATRRALLDHWNGHRWLPGDPSYLLDMLHGFDNGRLVLVEGIVQPARIVISIAEAAAYGDRRKPVARGCLGRSA